MFDVLKYEAISEKNSKGLRHAHMKQNEVMIFKGNGK